MALKGKTPESIKPSKPKFLISGPSGIGKTFFALSFPKPYLIDTEGGATQGQYSTKLKNVSGAYFGKEEGSQDFGSVIKEIEALATTKHEYKTLILDSFTYIYLLEAAKAELEVGSDFARDKKEANKPTRQLMRWLEKIDMNVILICHSKEKWGRNGKEIVSLGTTFDGYDKMEYILDLWIEIIKPADRQGAGGMFKVKKSRIESLPRDISFPLEYEQFAELYGKQIIEKAVVPIQMATSVQLKRIEELLEVVKVDDETIKKWFSKVDVDSWAEMTTEQIQSLIDFVQKKVNPLTEAKGGENGKTKSRIPATV